VELILTTTPDFNPVAKVLVIISGDEGTSFH
jgi:hypothetical protein